MSLVLAGCRAARNSKPCARIPPADDLERRGEHAHHVAARDAELAGEPLANEQPCPAQVGVPPPRHWEAEALPPEIMRAALGAAIASLVDDSAVEAHEVAKKSERKILYGIAAAKKWGGE